MILKTSYNSYDHPPYVQEFEGFLGLKFWLVNFSLIFAYSLILISQYQYIQECPIPTHGHSKCTNLFYHLNEVKFPVKK